jgi:hypothetical protein
VFAGAVEFAETVTVTHGAVPSFTVYKTSSRIRYCRVHRSATARKPVHGGPAV